MFITKNNLKERMEEVYGFEEIYDRILKEFNEELGDRINVYLKKEIESEGFLDKIIERIKRKQL